MDTTDLFIMHMNVAHLIALSKTYLFLRVFLIDPFVFQLTVPFSKSNRTMVSPSFVLALFFVYCC